MMVGIGESIIVILIGLCLAVVPLATLVLGVILYMRLQKIEAAIERLESSQSVQNQSQL
jgi:hypothetical protein